MDTDQPDYSTQIPTAQQSITLELSPDTHRSGGSQDSQAPSQRPSPFLSQTSPVPERLPSPFEGAIPKDDRSEPEEDDEEMPELDAANDDESEGGDDWPMPFTPEDPSAPLPRVRAEMNMLDFRTDEDFEMELEAGKFDEDGPYEQAWSLGLSGIPPIQNSRSGQAGVQGTAPTEPATKSAANAGPSSSVTVDHAKIKQAKEAARKVQNLESGDALADARAFREQAQIALEGIQGAFTTAGALLTQQRAAEVGPSSAPDTGQVACMTCPQTFDTKGQLKTHRAKDHSADVLHNVRVCESSVAHTVRREGPGLGFLCPRCGISNELPSNLRKHAATCKRQRPVQAEPEKPIPPRITLAYVRALLVQDLDGAFVQPNSTQQTNWTRRLGAVAVLNNQDLKKTSQLMERFYDDNKQYKGRLPLHIAEEVKHTCDEAMKEADNILDDRPVFELQLLACHDESQASRMRPMRLAPRTAIDYARTFEKLMMFIMSLVYLCYGEDMDFAGVPATEEGLETAIASISNADSTLKTLIKDAAVEPTPENYWRLGSYMYTTTLPDQPANSVLVNFVSALSLKQPVTGAFKTASDFTPELSRVIYVLRKCWGVAQHDRIGRLVQDMEDFRGDAWESVKSRDHFRQEAMRDAHRQAFGPDALYSCTWKWLDSVRAYGQACATSEEGMARVVWAPDSKSVRIGQHTIELAAMKTMMRMAIDDMNTSLRQLVSQSSAPLDPNQFPLENLVDDPTWSAPGASFATLEANEHMLHPEIFGNDMMPKIIDNNEANNNGVEGSNKVTLKVNDETWEYVEELEKKFLLAAVLAIHMTSGMPCRAEELTEATIMDSAGARPRSFVLGTDGDVFLHLTYSKSGWATNRKNLRLLHPAVGRMWAFYLAMLRPTLDACFQVKNKINRTYAWCKAPSTEGEHPTKWRGDTITEAMGDLATRAGLGFRLNVSTMRHFAEAVCHKFFRADVLDTNTDEANTASNLIAMGYEPGNEEEEHAFRDALDNVNRGNAVAGPSTPRSQDAFSAQSGRTLDTAWRLYARVIHHRAGMNDDIIARARLASLTWQSFWALSDVIVAFDTPNIKRHRAIEASSMFNPTSSEVFPTPTQSVISAPSSPTLIDMDSDKLKAMIRDAVNTGVATALAQQHVPPTSPTIPASPDTLQSGGSRIPLSVEDVKAMFKLHNTGTERKWNYKGVRSTAVADAMVHVSTGVTHVGCVAPCGAGKTDVIFMAILKAMEKKGMMVLIVPYRAAIKDMLNKLAARKISAVEWVGAQSVDESRGLPTAVVLTLERAVSQPFLTWISDQRILSKIHRVVMDEAQVLLDERNFRMSVRKFPQLTTLLKEKHWSFLSATIPPRLEKDFQNMVMLPVVFYRELTHRKNIVYSHQKYTSRQQLVIQLKDLIRKVTTGPNSSPDDQVLILCKSKNDALAYAAALGVEAYFTTDEYDGNGGPSRDLHFFNFFIGKTKVLVATPAASSSWDKPTVRCAVFIDGPYSITSYSQTEGRVCRDGRLGNVVIYQREEKKSPASIGPMIPTTDAEALKMLLSDTVCMRIPIGAWLDGRPTTCFELAGEMCSVCTRTLGPRHTGISSNPYPDSSDSDSEDSDDEYWRDLDFDNLTEPATQEKGKGKARATDKAGEGHNPRPRTQSSNNDNIGNKREGPPLDNKELKRARAATGRANIRGVTLPRAAVLRAALKTLDGEKNAQPKTVSSTAPAPATPANKYKRVSPGQRWNWGSYTDPSLLVSNSETSAGLSTGHLRAHTSPSQQTSWPMDSDSEDEDSRPVFLPSSPGQTDAVGGTRDNSGRTLASQTQLAVQSRDVAAAGNVPTLGTVSVGRPRATHGTSATNTSPPSSTQPQSSNNTRAPAQEDDAEPYLPPTTPVSRAPSTALNPPPPSGRPSATRSRVKTGTAQTQGTTPGPLVPPEDPDLRQWAIDLYGQKGLTMELPPNNTHESGQGRTYRAPEGLGAAQWFADANRFGPGSSRNNQGNALQSPSTSHGGVTTSPAGPSLHGLALESRTVSLQAVAQLQVQGEWTQAIKDILPSTRIRCPMCTLLGKPATHSPARCPTEHLDMAAQMKFRRDTANQWGYGQACYYCHLPQDFCRRRNEVKGCTQSEYKDLVRGLLMLMTAYPDMHTLGNDTAALFEEGYELPAPGGPHQMTPEWRETVYFKGMPMYRAFQAVAALLFLFDGRL